MAWYRLVIQFQSIRVVQCIVFVVIEGGLKRKNANRRCSGVLFGFITNYHFKILWKHAFSLSLYVETTKSDL